MRVNDCLGPGPFSASTKMAGLRAYCGTDWRIVCLVSPVHVFSPLPRSRSICTCMSRDVPLREA